MAVCYKTACKSQISTEKIMGNSNQKYVPSTDTSKSKPDRIVSKKMCFRMAANNKFKIKSKPDRIVSKKMCFRMAADNKFKLNIESFDADLPRILPMLSTEGTTSWIMLGGSLEMCWGG
jgi:hypothetical protein